MSSLKSVDMNIERSSTRLHAPPGGQSSFSIGGGWNDDAPVKPRQQVKAQPVQQQFAPQEAPARYNRSGNNSSQISFGDNEPERAPAQTQRQKQQARQQQEQEQVIPGLQNHYPREQQQQQQSSNRSRQVAGGFEDHMQNRHTDAPPVTGSKQSTRVVAPPGGASSFSLF